MQRLVIILYSNSVGGAEVLMHELVKAKKDVLAIHCIFFSYTNDGLDFKSLANTSVIGRSHHFGFGGFWLLLRALRTLAQVRPNVIFTNAWVPLFLGVIFAVPLKVVHFHHSDYRLENLGKLRRFVLSVSRFTRMRHVVLTPSISKGFREDYKLGSHIIHNPNRLECGLIKARTVDKNETHVLFVGRLVEEKGIVDLKRIIEHFRDADIHWHIIGPGPIFDIDNEKVRFHGTKSNLAEYYESCDYLINVSKREGFGNTIVEALCFGCLPLCYPLSGPRYIHDLHSGAHLARSCHYLAMIELINEAVTQSMKMSVEEIEQARKIFSKQLWIEKIADLIS